MISVRHVPALVVLLGLACVPTALHSYVGMTVSDHRSLERLPMRLQGLQGRPTERSPGWVRDVYGTSDFIERHYGPSTTLFVARSYDPKRLYHHPENGVAHGDGYDRAVSMTVPEHPEIPMFVLNSPRDRYSVYALLYDGRTIGDPIRFQIRNALTLLIRPKRPMTLFFVRGRNGSLDRPTAIATAQAFLVAAIDSFLAQSGTSSR